MPCKIYKSFVHLDVKVIMLQFGDKEKVWQLKLLNGAVYVRFGSSVMPFDEFLANNDPCRGQLVSSSIYLHHHIYVLLSYM